MTDFLPSNSVKLMNRIELLKFKKKFKKFKKKDLKFKI